MESNEHTELTRKMGTDSEMENRMTASRGEPEGVEGLSKKEKGLMDVDNCVVIAGEEGGIRGLNGNGKNSTKKELFISLRLAVTSIGLRS